MCFSKIIIYKWQIDSAKTTPINLEIFWYFVSTSLMHDILENIQNRTVGRLLFFDFYPIFKTKWFLKLKIFLSQTKINVKQMNEFLLLCLEKKLEKVVLEIKSYDKNNNFQNSLQNRLATTPKSRFSTAYWALVSIR